MAIAPETPQLARALRIACDLAGIDPTGARLIHHYSNAVYQVPNAQPHGQAVARVTVGAYRSAVATLAQLVTRWLIHQESFPATAPYGHTQPVQVDNETIVTFWRYYPQGNLQAPLTSEHLGHLLRRLHDLGEPPTALPAWQPLTSLEAVLQPTDDLGGDNAVCASERSWLLLQVKETKAELAEVDWALGTGLLHGDAWAGNLLWDNTTPSPRALLGDWDGLAQGPREVDLVPTWHAAVRYGRGDTWIETFVEQYGFDLRNSPGYRPLMRMRDLMQITGPLRRAAPGNVFEAVLRQRIAGIRDPRQETTWTAL